jgi:hypothetical protein
MAEWLILAAVIVAFLLLANHLQDIKDKISTAGFAERELLKEISVRLDVMNKTLESMRDKK